MATTIRAGTEDGSAPAPADGTTAPPAPPAPRARPAWRSRLYRLDLKAAPYAFVAPFFLCFAAFGLFPLLWTGWLSLHHVDLLTPDTMEWRGLDNYTRLWGNDQFWTALRNTFTIGVISTVPQLAMALGLAHLLNYRLRGRGFFRVAILAPYATSIAAATLVFVQLFNPDYGLINWFLSLFGVHGTDWYADTWPSQIAISTIVTWRWTGYNALIYLAAMQAVPKDLYEAASLDGASRWQQFTRITVPSIRPTILFTIVVSTIGATQLFGEPLLFGGGVGVSGGSAHQFQTLSLYLYELGWPSRQLGRASAVAWTMLLLLLLIGAVQHLFTRRNRAQLGG
ncbi:MULTISPECIES: carbohydrate ABC transporter permease [Kitasatospora]|uniref:Cellobiose transport system permease protein n=2 Tax=Kitasatospora TaxID=2063 RepID=A0ABT1IZ86_9ACTN|nr:cellobiose transport system permease protein [Kitasatospora paracochleata]